MTSEQTTRQGGENRRGFLAKAFTWLGLGSLAASLASTVYANFRFFFPKVLYEPPAQFKIGAPGDYQAGMVSDRWVKEYQVWVIREKDALYALLTVCTHLGCLTGFFPGEGLFKCPCHGSNFSLEGDPVAGPAPVPLYRLYAEFERRRADSGRQESAENRPGPRSTPLHLESLKHGTIEHPPLDYRVAIMAIGLPSWSGGYAAGASLTVFSNFFLHLHPVSLPAGALRFTFTWGLGGTALLLFLILVASGILLTFYYVPDVDRAYESMKDLQFAVPFGVFLRNVHRWSAQAMVLVVMLHMARSFIRVRTAGRASSTGWWASGCWCSRCC